MMTYKLVYDVEPATPSMIKALDRHCRFREPNGISDIDPGRSNLNRTLFGSDEGVGASLKEFYEGDVSQPSSQAESPYLRIVVSASPEYFRPGDPDAAGTWNNDRLENWVDATMEQLKKEHDDDLVYVELHLDETTPHIHAVVAPTYIKKKRTPGKQKRNETDDEFALRKLVAQTSPGQRVVSRSSHKTLSRKNSFTVLRQNMTDGLSHLGIIYGESRSVDSPDPKTTRQWTKEETLRAARENLAAEMKSKIVRAAEDDLDRREEEVTAARNSVLLLAGVIKRCGQFISKFLGLKPKEDLVEMLDQIEEAVENMKMEPEDPNEDNSLSM